MPKRTRRQKWQDHLTAQEQRLRAMEKLLTGKDPGREIEGTCETIRVDDPPRAIRATSPQDGKEG